MDRTKGLICRQPLAHAVLDGLAHRERSNLTSLKEICHVICYCTVRLAESLLLSPFEAYDRTLKSCCRRWLEHSKDRLRARPGDSESAMDNI